MTITPNLGAGTNPTLQIVGNKFNGRVSITTGANPSANSLCRINVDDGDGYDTDTVLVILQQRAGTPITLMPASEEGNGFEVIAFNDLLPNTTYEFNYTATSIQNDQQRKKP